MNIIMVDEERYTNRQIERMLDSQSTDIKEHIDKAIGPLTAQVFKTNGRVGWLEKMVWMATGAVLVLFPITGWVLIQVSGLKASSEAERASLQLEIQTAVDNSLESRVQKVTQ